MQVGKYKSEPVIFKKKEILTKNREQLENNSGVVERKY